MRTILRITGFIVAFTFLMWAYFNYPFWACGVTADGQYISCNLHGYLNSVFYPLGYAVAALASLGAIIFIYMEIDKHRKRRAAENK